MQRVDVRTIMITGARCPPPPRPLPLEPSLPALPPVTLSSQSHPRVGGRTGGKVCQRTRLERKGGAGWRRQAVGTPVQKGMNRLNALREVAAGCNGATLFGFHTPVYQLHLLHFEEVSHVKHI